MQYDGILEAISIPLHGRHMIEASAGTGKTYNITRIYVRLLLEKKLSVRQILVMTFTEAATEEIKHRISVFISELIDNLVDSPCEFSLSMQHKVGAAEMLAILNVAKLEIDLAAIYTLHGFCQRVISRYGLRMATPQDAKLETDFTHIKLNYITDAIRSLQKLPQQFLLLQQHNWHDPQLFLKTFQKVIANQKLQTPKTKTELIQICASRFNQYWAKSADQRNRLVYLLNTNKALVCSGLKSGKLSQIETEIELASAWLNRSFAIDENRAQSFVSNWLGLNDASKQQIKDADNELLSPQFTKIFSTARIKNYALAGYEQTHPLLSEGIAWLSEFSKIGVKTENKKIIINSLNKAQSYQVVAHVVKQVNARLNAHKQQNSVIGFDDLIENVARSISKDNQALLSNLREQYPVALVDEFQDTDEFQYTILDKLYPKGTTQHLLLMIGDPKQAIYSFRGGDIFTYLKARENADFLWGMDVNYRSSRQVINAYNRIFHGNALTQASVDLFGYSINYPIVNSPDTQVAKEMLVDPNNSLGPSAFSFVFSNNIPSVSPQVQQTNRAKDIPSTVQEYEVLHWCAKESARLLSDVKIKKGDELCAVKSSDIAILVRSAKQARMVKKIFDEYKLSTVYLSERSSLFLSQQALDVLYLMQAVDTSSRENTRKALSTGLLALDLTQHAKNSSKTQTQLIEELLVDENHSLWMFVFSSLADCKRRWQTQGVFGMLLHIFSLVQKVGKNVERSLTNYLHIAELLANAATTHKQPLQLIYWLQQQITDPIVQDSSELRLESDQKVIQVITQHKAKGLEYPIVFLPFANNEPSRITNEIAIYHDDNYDLVAELGLSQNAKVAIQDEAKAEDMRLLYVALTRPVLRCYLGMVALKRRNESALMRALGVSVSNNNEQTNLGRALYEDVKQCLNDVVDDLSFFMADENDGNSHVITPEQHIPVQALGLSAAVNQQWHVTSFSRLSDRLSGKTNTTNVQALDTNNVDAKVDISSENVNTNLDYRFSFMKGPDAGNFLHDLLENLDFSAAQPQQAVLNLIQEMAVDKVNGKTIDLQALCSWMEQVIKAPIMLGTSCDLSSSDHTAFSLNLLNPEQVLKESEFYYPITNLVLAKFLQIVNQHRHTLAIQFGVSVLELESAVPHSMDVKFESHTNKPIQEHRELAMQGLSTQTHYSKSWHQLKNDISGAMHGFIDLIFEYQGRYYVADYKSNYLGADPQNYQAQSLCEDMLHHQYDVQYLIYSLALHRYLQVNIDNYNYQAHFGGVLYFYLRGMGITDEQNNSLGVFSTNVDEAIIQALDDLFSGENSIDSILQEQFGSLLAGSKNEKNQGRGR